MKDLLGREEAVTVEKAISLLLEQPLKIPSTESTGIENAHGRVLSADVISPENLPGFNRSTMDGYAVNSTDTFGASDSMPAYLTVAGEVHMGTKPDFSLTRGEAGVIPTGGMLPDGADAVVMYEHTNRVGEDILEVMKAVAPNENVILADEDVKEGAVILRSGQRLRPQDIGALAGLGIVNIKVFKKPVVAIISTGDEVVPPDKKPLAAGEVRDINSCNLAGLIMRSGGIPLKKGIISDDFDLLRATVRESMQEAQMVLISGGSSVGTRDYTSRVIDELGHPGILFHGVSIKPGKPLIGGMVNGIPLFGLPGHPAAVSVCFETFIEPLLKRISGEKRRKDLLPAKKTVRAFFGRNISSSTGREDHIRVALELRDDGLWARPILGKSGLIRTLVDADGTVIIPLNKSGIYEGETVEVIIFSECPG
ncbi:Molybdopterin molybdenumtransferase [hydrothermal vent metagenome]|uniref:molybdopterin molybdotransferase n=1 Tax=hydrothermal vent metagenome TaxID=652676 RepID=A0A3B1D4L5_9ZZZZ